MCLLVSMLSRQLIFRLRLHSSSAFFFALARRLRGAVIAAAYKQTFAFFVVPPVRWPHENFALHSQAIPAGKHYRRNGCSVPAPYTRRSFGAGETYRSLLSVRRGLI